MKKTAEASPEAYNKTLPESHPGHGTLVGNWNEEQVLRKKTGIGRVAPGEHVPKLRSTLYSTDFQSTAKPSKNNTFQRCFPDPNLDFPITANHEYGRFDDKASKVRTIGKRWEAMEKQVKYSA